MKTWSPVSTSVVRMKHYFWKVRRRTMMGYHEIVVEDKSRTLSSRDSSIT